MSHSLTVYFVEYSTNDIISSSTTPQPPPDSGGGARKGGGGIRKGKRMFCNLDSVESVEII
jgi:hypothetical protein